MVTQVSSVTYKLDKGQKRWQLHLPQHPEFKPFALDFTSGSYLNIHKKGLGKKDPLAKAIGIKSGTTKVLDLTAGWLKDTWMLLHLGCKVKACEMNSLVFSILQNAIELDKSYANYEELFSNLELVNLDSLEVLQSENISEWDCLFIDPMFPQRSKKALAGKEMQILQELVAEKDSGELILTEALQMRAKRVVVKRPLKGPELLSGVSFKVESKASRFDVYIN